MSIRFLASPRLWIGLVVTAAWLASMSGLLRRETGISGSGLKELGVSPEVLLVSWNNYDHWMSISQNGRPLGFSELHILARTQGSARRPGGRVYPGYFLTSRTRLKFMILSQQLPVDLQIRADMNHAFELESVQAQGFLGGFRLLLQGFTQGNQLYYRARIGSQQQDWATTNSMMLGEADMPTSVSTAGAALQTLLSRRDVCGRAPLRGPIMLTDVIGPIILRTEKLHPGMEWSTRAANSLLGGKLDTPLRVRVERIEEILVRQRPVEAWRMTERVGSMVSTVWYDLSGNMVRRELASGIVLERVGESHAKARDPEFTVQPDFPPLDRQYIRKHLTPELTDRPLGELLPVLPQI